MANYSYPDFYFSDLLPVIFNFEDWGCSIDPSFTSNLESIVIGGRQIPTEPLGEHMREGARASACVLMLPLLPDFVPAREPARLSCSFSNSVAFSGHPLKNAHFLFYSKGSGLPPRHS
jgi:hypothetical protein